jgi:hypothetical protein
MDQIIETSSSNSNFGKRGKKDTIIIIGNLGKVEVTITPVKHHHLNTKRYH